VNRNRKLALLISGSALAGLAVLYLPDLMGTGASGPIDASHIGATVLGSIGVAYLGGVLTALTPCVYPLIPITVSVFGARQAESRGKALLLTSLYVLGMAAMFSGLGVAAASSGKAFGTILASRWMLVGLALFFAVMATSMFGAFDIALPQGVAQRLSQVGGSGYGGAFAMGLVAGIVAAPCTGPVLASLLTFVATSGKPLFGFGLLFTYALGIGLPFFLIGAFSMSLPRSGAWMEGVKSVFGIALLALALTYLRDAVPGLKGFLAPLAPYAAATAVIVALGVLAGAVHRSYHDGIFDRALKTFGVAAVALGIFIRVSVPHDAQAAQATNWVHDHDAAITAAHAAGKPMMIDFFADWCAACKELDKFTYSDPTVAAESSRFVNLKVDGTIEDDKLLALYAKYGVVGLPTVVFLDSKGQLLPEPRITGFLEAPKMKALMEKVR
jgi:thiol:disulfide interchange protein DsbD